jgi:hypothetical protein
LCVLAVVLSVYEWWPMVSSYPNTMGHDGEQHQMHLEAVRISIARYHEFPMWNPFECHGLALWDNPQGMAAAPMAWTALLIGTTAALQLWIVLHVAIGFVSMWLLARHELKLSLGPAFVAAAAWTFAGNFALQYTAGHLTFGAFSYFPLGVLLWRRAENDIRAAIGTGALLALMICEGATYPLVYMLMILGLESLTRLRSLERIKNMAIAAGVVGLVALTVAACRTLPVIDQLRWHKRGDLEDVDALKWSTLKDMFLARRTYAWEIPGQQYVWHEMGCYVGPIILGLAAIGIVLGGVENLWLFVVLVAMLALMAGHQGKYAPWHLLYHHVPPFSQLRIPTRFRPGAVMAIAAYAGIAVDRIQRRYGDRAQRAGLGDVLALGIMALALIGVGDIMTVGQMIASTTGKEWGFDSPPQAAQISPSPRLYEEQHDPRFIELPDRNVASSTCLDNWAWGRPAKGWWQGDVLQARATNDAASVESVVRTQNTYTIVVNAARPARIRLNSTYDRNWQADVGTTSNDNMLLAVDVPAGHQIVHVRYWPRWFNVGVVVNILGIAGSVLLWRWDAKRRGRGLGAC